MHDDELPVTEYEVNQAFEDLTYCCYMEITAKEKRKAAYVRYIELRDKLQRQQQTDTSAQAAAPS